MLLKEKHKIVSARVLESLCKECKKKLIDDNKTFTDLIISAILQYINGTLKIQKITGQ